MFTVEYDTKWPAGWGTNDRPDHLRHRHLTRVVLCKIKISIDLQLQFKLVVSVADNLTQSLK